MTTEQRKMAIEDGAKACYERYYQAREGRDLGGHPLPSWDGLQESGRAAFRAEALAELPAEISVD